VPSLYGLQRARQEALAIFYMGFGYAISKKSDKAIHPNR